jgi:hypothetical protein
MRSEIAKQLDASRKTVPLHVLCVRCVRGSRGGKWKIHRKPAHGSHTSARFIHAARLVFFVCRLFAFAPESDGVCADAERESERFVLCQSLPGKQPDVDARETRPARGGSLFCSAGNYFGVAKITLFATGNTGKYGLELPPFISILALK